MHIGFIFGLALIGVNLVFVGWLLTITASKYDFVNWTARFELNLFVSMPAHIVDANRIQVI